MTANRVNPLKADRAGPIWLDAPLPFRRRDPNARSLNSTFTERPYLAPKINIPAFPVAKPIDTQFPSSTFIAFRK
jgi:hypothetical protein